MVSFTDPHGVGGLPRYPTVLRPGWYRIGHYKSEGGAAVMINMGVNGLVTMLFVVMVGGDLNGPTIGGIFTVVGFSATGKHLRNILPVMAGVLIASEGKSWNITDPSAILALLLSTTLAPIAGEFGIIAGVIAGFFAFFRSAECRNRVRRHESLQQRVRRRPCGYVPGSGDSVHPRQTRKSTGRIVAVAI